MDQLKLLALDEEDLAILSAHVQDAVLKISDVKWLPKENRFVLAMNRFAWEAPPQASGRGKRSRKNFERRRSVLHFERVNAVRATRIRQKAEGAVLELLAIRFEAGKAPAGTVELVFAGGGAIRLEVECIEAQLSDLGAAWATENLPTHDLGETE